LQAGAGAFFSRMNATEAFVTFVTRALTTAKARKFAVLASSKKGQIKALDGLYHDFEPAVRNFAICPKDYSKVWEKPCYAFHARVGFGAEFSTVRHAYDDLAMDDNWLIVLQDGSAAIHRPEARWYDEKLIEGLQTQ
jgi:hypothetical protein